MKEIKHLCYTCEKLMADSFNVTKIKGNTPKAAKCDFCKKQGHLCTFEITNKTEK